MPPDLLATIDALGPGERARVGWIERFGLSPAGQAWREARKAIAGNEGTPPFRPQDFTGIALPEDPRLVRQTSPRP